VVTELKESAVPAAALTSLDQSASQHLVSLQSVEDDGLGEEVQVLWELEPGTVVYERATLPDPTAGFDDPRRLDAFLDAVRWGAVASAYVRNLHAPFQSGITIEDYQLDPVVRALQMPRVNLLIADDVGLGKTIEAGLVVQELILRNRARTILVVCPAGLQIQWRDEMREKFGLEFRIVDSDLMKELRRSRGLRVNPWGHFPRLITSIDYLKRDRPLRQLHKLLPPEGQPPFPRRFDLLIVDEAHNVAPSGGAQYAVDSQRTQAIRTLAPHFEHKLFLTATPHNGYTESFSALLELLDDQRFARGVPPDPKHLGAVMVRRLKRELPPDDLGRPRFPKRVLRAIEVPYTEQEHAAHQALNRYARLRQRGRVDRTERFATEFVLKLLKKRLFSSPEAFRLTLEKHADSLRGRTARNLPRPSLRLLQREVERAQEDSADDDAGEEQRQEAVQSTTALFRPLEAEEEILLAELREWATRSAGRPDSKAGELVCWLDETLRPGGQWNDTRVILFTEYRATQNWLQTILASHGFTQEGRLLTLYGGMDSDERERIKAAFQADPSVAPVRILLATDSASEGISLQRHCSRLIHYEIPWNPNRMEQRNGRIDRHGQRADEVSIFHFVGEGYAERAKTPDTAPGDLDGDLEFLMRAARKVEQIREDLGNVGDVIATQVEEAMLGHRHRFDPDADSPRARAARAMLRVERDVRERIQRLHERLHTSREKLRLSPDNVRAAVEVGLQLAEQPPLRPVAVPGHLPGSQATAYRLPPLCGSWAACAEGLDHPHTKEIRPVVFDDKLATGRDDVVLAHLGHRLVQMCLRLLRAEVWAPEGRQKLARVSARVVPGDTLDHPVAIAHGRLVVLGSKGERLHEELITAGGVLREGRFARFNVGQVHDALAAADHPGTTDAPDAIKANLASLWEAHRDALLAALEARMRDRTAGLIGELAKRADKDVADLTGVLPELRAAIERELQQEAPAQLDLWPSQEREQLERNTEALRARADAIPAEIERETVAIRARYRDPTPRLFPVAVTYLVPEGLA